jgi:crotonobetainyl-CoA:carnitine CoA-transferase CaiB-like acyl-CoA transferase
MCPVQVGNNHPPAHPWACSTPTTAASTWALGEGNWKRFCDALNKPDWYADPEFQTEPLRVKHRDRLNALIAIEFKKNTVKTLG